MSNTQQPLISVVIPVYNPGEHLRRCLDSIITQTYRNLEIILIDDGSTDHSLDICKEYAEKDNRILVHHKENSGVSATRNQGIRLAHGDYFSFIDSDDYIDNDMYEYLLGLACKHNADIVNFEHFVTYPDREVTHRISDENYGLFDRAKSMDIFIRYFPFACNKLFSKKTIDGVWFNEDICRGEDSLFACEAFDNADNVYFDSRPMYHYIQSENSAVRGEFRKSQLTAVKLIDIYEPFFREKYPQLYDTQMGMLMNLMTTLYFDMCNDTKKLKNEKALVVDKFRQLYKKINLKNLPKKRRSTLKLFKASPQISYFVRRTNLALRRIARGK